ncbi:BTB/POZ domain-containing protein kctd16-like protein [Elysia marginata]|uniref:BTB/POZ domain-containing protein kctd16-like protein n=1 Tax=Elysia marginata TaxID=1093978 RepID=A0AAV4ICU2_9GAST|nr:BTB/POZ domain-containing protein kctd16-like protein [Elysia marginata]
MIFLSLSLAGAVSREVSGQRSGPAMNDTGSGSSNSVLELNVGGVFYSTNLATLRREPDSHIARLFTDHSKVKATKDAKGKYFIDRDGVLFR